jgi:hypothetical protein
MSRTKDAVNWPPADEEQLRQLWEVEGRSSGDIAWIMGRTRNAIIGKVVRMKLARRHHRVQPKIKPFQKRTHSGDSSLARIIRAKVMPLLPKPKAGDAARARGAAWLPLPGTTPIGLLDLDKGKCRWPVTDDSPFLFCGAPCEGVYCDHHAALATGLGTASERLADSLSRKAA